MDDVIISRDARIEFPVLAGNDLAGNDVASNDVAGNGVKGGKTTSSTTS